MVLARQLTPAAFDLGVGCVVSEAQLRIRIAAESFVWHSTSDATTPNIGVRVRTWRCTCPFSRRWSPCWPSCRTEFPQGEGWLFEPKWDGFRAIVFRDGESVYIQSRDLKPLDRYFPELPPALKANLPDRCIVDGEIVIPGPNGLEFESLLLRIHPAESRVRMLAEQTPASFVGWDLLALGDRGSAVDAPGRAARDDRRCTGQG